MCLLIQIGTYRPRPRANPLTTLPTNNDESFASIEKNRRSANYPREEMTNKTPKTAGHRHSAVVTHMLRQRSGVPYEVELKTCKSCHRVLDERTVRRAAA